MLVLGRIDGSPSRYISRSASSSLVIQNLLRRRIHLKKCSSILSESCALPASSSRHAYIMIYTFVLRKATACFKEAVAVSTCTTRTRRLTRRAVPALPCATRKKKKKGAQSPCWISAGEPDLKPPESSAGLEKADGTREPRS